MVSKKALKSADNLTSEIKAKIKALPDDAIRHLYWLYYEDNGFFENAIRSEYYARQEKK